MDNFLIKSHIENLILETKATLSNELGNKYYAGRLDALYELFYFIYKNNASSYEHK